MLHARLLVLSGVRISEAQCVCIQENSQTIRKSDGTQPKADHRIQLYANPTATPITPITIRCLIFEPIYAWGFLALEKFPWVM